MREALQPGTMLQLSDEGREIRLQILEILGDGSTCICYLAQNLAGQRCRIKEYFPLGSAHGEGILERDPVSHHVRCIPGFPEQAQAYRRRLADTKESYARIAGLRTTDPALESFITEYKALTGLDENGHAAAESLYLCCDDIPLVTLEDYAAQARKDLSKAGNFLFVLLNSFVTIAECIGILHRHGWLHLDLKPKNIGFLQRDGKLLTESLRLFDVDSFCQAAQPNHVPKYTPVFAAPELKIGQPTYASDIYALGASLYDLLVHGDPGTERGVKPLERAKISGNICSAAPVKATDAACSVELKKQLCAVVETCLQRQPENRYGSCEELAQQLQVCIKLLLPARFAHVGGGKRLVLADVQEHLDCRTGALQLPMLRHLFAHPLYENWDGGDLRLLVLGAGNAAQSFLDAALPLGVDLCRSKICAVVAAEDAAQAQTMYLAGRPAMKDFFDLYAEAKKEDYGALRFVKTTFSGTKEDEPVLQALLKENDPHYLFIAVGGDGLALHLARLCAKLRQNVSINYILEEKKPSRCPGNALWAEEASANDPVTARLGAMARNVHLLWQSREDGCVRNEKAKILDAYHEQASLAAAVSIPYKFRALGLSYERPGDAAKYDAMLRDDAVLREMAWAEHRRWCTHKVCSSYTRRTDFDTCVEEQVKTGTVKDTVRRRHLCIVPGTDAMPLQNWSRTKWDTAGEKDLAKLDPLDRVSVQLHQAYVRAAKKAKTDGVLSGTVPAAMAQLVRADLQTNDAWFALYGCLSRIWLGEEAAAAQYEPLLHRFVRCFEENLPGSTVQLKSLTAVLRSSFDPIVRSLRRFDFKQNDLRVVKGASFVSTYRADLHLAAALPGEGSHGRFSAACAAMMLDPAMLTLCAYAGEDGAVQTMEESAGYLHRCFDRRQLQTAMTLVLGAPESRMRALRAAAQSLRRLPRVSRVELICAESRKDYEKALQLRLAALQPDAAQQPGLPELSCPSFTPDLKNGTFLCEGDFPLFACVPWDKSLRVEELFPCGLHREQALPVVDHEALQALYLRDPALWRRCCKTLAAGRTPSAVFDRSAQTGRKISLSLLLHSTAAEAAQMLAAGLEEKGLLRDADFGEHSFGFVRLQLQTDETYADAMEDLFAADPCALSACEAPEISEEGDVCTVCLRPLMVDHMILPEWKEAFLGWLEQLHRLELISRPRHSGGTVSFHYHTAGARSLMTCPERVHTICLYGQLRGSGKFRRVIDGKSVPELSGLCDLLAAADLRSFFVCMGKKPSAALRRLVKEHGICPTIVCVGVDGTSTEDVIYCKDAGAFLQAL